MPFVIVDTENYAGNFVRDFTYYTTGCTGGAPSPLAEQARKEMRHAQWWDENLVEQAVSEGRSQIATITATPQWFNDGYGRHFHVDDEQAQHITTRCAAYLSVRLRTRVLPPQEVWDEFQERAIEFSETIYPQLDPGRNTITLTGARQEQRARKPKF